MSCPAPGLGCGDGRFDVAAPGPPAVHHRETTPLPSIPMIRKATCCASPGDDPAVQPWGRARHRRWAPACVIPHRRWTTQRFLLARALGDDWGAETVRVRAGATVLWRAGPVWVRCPWSWCSPVLGSPPGSNGGAVAMYKKCFFGIITRKAIRRSSFHNIGGLTRKINAFVEHDNAQARPPNFWQSLPRGGRSEAQGSVQGWHQHWWVLADHPPERFPGHWPADALPRGRT